MDYSKFFLQVREDASADQRRFALGVGVVQRVVPPALALELPKVRRLVHRAARLLLLKTGQRPAEG